MRMNLSARKFVSKRSLNQNDRFPVSGVQSTLRWISRGAVGLLFVAYIQSSLA